MNVQEGRYNNYHKHSHYSNIRTLDVVSKPIDYIKRAKELGHNSYFTVEHGFGGNVWEAYTLCKQHDLKCIFGVEAYYVDDINVKERKMSHLILIALNKDGYKDINRIMSKANKEGFYYKPRIDLQMLLSLNPNNVIVTTACVAGRLFKTENYKEEFLEPLLNHFKTNLYLEVQNHNEGIQKEWNKKVLELSKEYNIKIIHANDSHYILKDDSKYRDLFLKAKGIIYEDESSFILDYPSTNEILERYKLQGVLDYNQTIEAINNTLIFDKCEDLDFDKEFKIPKACEGDSNEELKSILNYEFNKKFENMETQKKEQYKLEIEDEYKTIVDCGMSDYFILNYKIVNRAVNEYDGVLTRSGRGCFTEDSLVHTKKGLKSIKDVKIGDEVITKDGKFNMVYNTMVYDIDEELVKIKHKYGTDTHYPTICTKDHKILINRNDVIQWVQAINITSNDYVCVPKIKNNLDNFQEVIDLNDYNIYGFKYDEEYIYEKSHGSGLDYKYSPSDIARKVGVGNSAIEKFSNGKQVFAKSPYKLKKIFDYIPFDTQEEYCKFIKERRTKKIKRFINNDYEFNVFIGLMYGDGFTAKKNNSEIGLAINRETDKDRYNRMIFNNIANRIGVTVKENVSKTKKLSQLYFKSKVFRNYFDNNLFISKIRKEKQFNDELFNQPIDNLKGIVKGLLQSDGTYGENDKNRISFDNTSKSIVNAFKLLCLMTNEGICSLSTRNAHIDSRGYSCKESYKLRLCSKKNFSNIKQDDSYWFLPITETILLPKTRTKVYDISVKNEPNYLLNNMIVHNSAVSFLTNKVLGLTEVDMMKAPVTLYPSRFMTSQRILKSRSLPDIDLNWAEVEPVIKASKDILGEDGIYYMVAYKPLQESSAFRLWCKAMDLKVSDYNDIAKNLDEYVNDEYWGKIIEESKVFRGVIESISPSPCSFLLYDKPISEEVGLIKVGDVICCNLDGYNCDVYKYLKNDYLK